MDPFYIGNISLYSLLIKQIKFSSINALREGPYNQSKNFYNKYFLYSLSNATLHTYTHLLFLLETFCLKWLLFLLDKLSNLHGVKSKIRITVTYYTHNFERQLFDIG